MAVSETCAAELLTSLVDLIRTARCAAHKEHERDVTGTLIGVLRLVAERDVRPGDLAVQLMVASSVASRAVAALDAEGLVDRRPDPADARACRIGITDRGRDLLLERQQRGLDRLINALAEWDDDDAVAAATVLSRLERSLSATMPSVPPAPKTLADTVDFSVPHLESSAV